MNDDIISRSALKKAVENLVAGGAERLKDYYENGSKSDENSWIGGVYDSWEQIDNAPPVEPFEPEELKGLRLENEVILRRLKHLLESDFISQFDKVDPNTNEYIRNIKEADWKVAYLCDQNKSCNYKCAKDHHCKRTCDISHAKNFRLVPNGIYPIMFEEVDEHCIASFSFDREQLQEIVNEQVIEPIKKGELVVKREKRPTGHWIITNKKYELKDKDNTFVGMYHKCSECGFDEARGGKFCLNCGADMQEEENERK